MSIFAAMTLAALIPAPIAVGASTGTALSAGLAGESIAADEEPQWIWTRRFDQPLREVPIVIVPQGEQFAVWSPTLGNLRDPVDLPLHLTTECEVVTNIEPSLYGFTIVYTITNRTGQAVNLPTLQLPGMLLADRVDHLDHRLGSLWEVIDASDGLLKSSRKELYPQSLYAPAIILRDQRVAVGFSLQYDLLTYQHQIRTNVFRGATGSSYGDRWTARFLLEDSLKPGGSRTYRLNVWFNEPQDWIHTMRPYRAYLRTMYGPVRYQQNLRPVWLRQLGDTLYLSENNPRGFNNLRADLHGFRRDVDSTLDFTVPAGYRRVMIRTPAGVYFENRQNNFPPQIMTEWTLPMIASSEEWSRFEAAGIDLYFWWGRSAQVADRWDDDTLDSFDPGNPLQRQRMLLEWENAVAIGAKGLGLDKFTPLMPWQALDWIAELRTKRPDALLVAEPAAYDVLHLHVPTFLYSEDVPTPHYLADYLTPGRELWVMLGDGEGNLERAVELMTWGHTIVTTTRNFTAEELLREARHRGIEPEPFR